MLRLEGTTATLAASSLALTASALSEESALRKRDSKASRKLSDRAFAHMLSDLEERPARRQSGEEPAEDSTLFDFESELGDEASAVFKAYKPRKMVSPHRLTSQQDKAKYQESSLEFGRWTKEERIRFMRAHILYGKDWIKIRDYIGTRSDRQIRSHAQKFFLKAQYGMGYLMHEQFDRLAGIVKSDLDAESVASKTVVCSTDCEEAGSLAEADQPAVVALLKQNDEEADLFKAISNSLLPFQVERVTKADRKAARQPLKIQTAQEVLSGK